MYREANQMTYSLSKQGVDFDSPVIVLKLGAGVAVKGVVVFFFDNFWILLQDLSYTVIRLITREKNLFYGTFVSSSYYAMINCTFCFQEKKG